MEKIVAAIDEASWLGEWLVKIDAGLKRYVPRLLAGRYVCACVRVHLRTTDVTSASISRVELPELTEQHLADLNVAPGDRIKLLREIKVLCGVRACVSHTTAPSGAEEGQEEEEGPARTALVVVDVGLVGQH
jgi:hypothetical protein